MCAQKALCSPLSGKRTPIGYTAYSILVAQQDKCSNNRNEQGRFNPQEAWRNAVNLQIIDCQLEIDGYGISQLQPIEIR